MVVIKSVIANWVYSKAHLLLETCGIQNQILVQFGAFSLIWMFVPNSCLCKKQTAVSHDCEEAEIISLDAGHKSSF